MVSFLQPGRGPGLLKKIPVPSSSFGFRPIALLCFLSKVLEKLPSDEVVNFLATKNILDSFPTGFRKFHNTQTVLLKLIDDIQVGGKIGLPPSCCNFTLVKPSTKYNRLGFSRSWWDEGSLRLKNYYYVILNLKLFFSVDYV